MSRGIRDRDEIEPFAGPDCCRGVRHRRRSFFSRKFSHNVFSQVFLYCVNLIFVDVLYDFNEPYLIYGVRCGRRVGEICLLAVVVLRTHQPFWHEHRPLAADFHPGHGIDYPGIVGATGN